MLRRAFAVECIPLRYMRRGRFPVGSEYVHLLLNIVNIVITRQVIDTRAGS